MGMLDKTGIGERIRALRGDSTQKEFASRVGVGRTSVVRYEAGERTPDAEFIAKLNEVLGVDPMWLLTGEEAKAAPLKPDEAALLDNYRNSPEPGKAAIKTTSAAFAQSKVKKKSA